MTDEKRVEDLEKRIDELESMVRSMLPSRRDALKLGVAGVAGAAAMSGSASANAGTDDGEVGTIGDASDKVDMFAQDIEVETINSDNILTSGDSTDRAIFVISSGASDPAAATNDDIIFEEE